MPSGIGRGMGVMITHLIFMGLKFVSFQFSAFQRFSVSAFQILPKRKGRHGFPNWGKIRDGPGGCR
jgi:hypothetical protein